MYTISESKQLNARFSDFEKATTDKFLLSFQKDTGKEYSNFKNLFLDIISKYNELENELNDLVNQPILQPDNSKFVEKIEAQQATIENLQKQLSEKSEASTIEKLPESLAEKFTEINNELFPELGTLSELQILETLQEVVQMKDETPPAPVEIIKEVERQLADNELLVNLKPQQKQLLLDIAAWRFSNRLDAVQDTPGNILRRMAFREYVLIDYMDEFATGLKSKQVKQ